ncbi:CD3324 family protein [Exiguobacterium sp. MMG028]|uniref:CD3324 family protein n=1 Tax=unclassified Exiguobacterium TaxID=2644629 RepID=UPI00093DC682|nr:MULTISPECIES: CD3324 family protein [unclassified Exiguobacterium]MDA5561243.1 CD3324 family protein [Exiguobacterium sp. MMG028]
MKYVNAQHILPEHLLREVQQYVQGETLYVPTPTHTKRKWGTVNGGKQLLEERNEAIRAAFRNGERIDSLAMSYHLATHTIRKIVYRST